MVGDMVMNKNCFGQFAGGGIYEGFLAWNWDSWMGDFSCKNKGSATNIP